MENEFPRYILEARKLFEGFERDLVNKKINYEKLTDFNKAIDILNNHQNNCQNCTHTELIKNIKTANTRTLINNLDKVDQDFGTWINIFWILSHEVESETKELIEEPKLNKKYNDFMDLANIHQYEIINHIEKLKQIMKHT